jgi:hypothetical protein
MKNLAHKIWVAISGVWKIHIGISTAVSLVAIAAIVYHFFLKEGLALLLGKISAGYNSNSLLHAILTGIASSIVAAVLFGIFGVFVLSWYAKIRLTGRYNAFAVDANGGETAWGRVTIKYHPLSTNTHHTPVKLSLAVDDIVLEGDGLIVDNRYLIGHYSETGMTERRRAGSFMYELDGAGKAWSGNYICIDPSSGIPTVSKAVWRRS